MDANSIGFSNWPTFFGKSTFPGFGVFQQNRPGAALASNHIYRGRLQRQCAGPEFGYGRIIRLDLYRTHLTEERAGS